MKKRLLLLILSLSLAYSAKAQAELEDSVLYNTEALEECPLFDVLMPPATLGSLSPYGAWDVWQLHEGANARFSFNAAAGFGKGAPRGVGLEERIDFAYAGRLGKRWTYALMLQGSNMTWGPVRQRNISMTGIVGYRASERFSLYAYVSKSLMNDGEGFSLGYWSPMGQPAEERIGFVADWTIGENAWIQVCFEASRIKFDAPSAFYNPQRFYGAPPMRSIYW